MQNEILLNPSVTKPEMGLKREHINNLMADCTLVPQRPSELAEELLQKVPWDLVLAQREIGRVGGPSCPSSIEGRYSCEMKAAGLILWMPPFQQAHSRHLLELRAQEYTTTHCPGASAFPLVPQFSAVA